MTKAAVESDFCHGDAAFRSHSGRAHQSIRPHCRFGISFSFRKDQSGTGDDHPADGASAGRSLSFGKPGGSDGVGEIALYWHA